MIMTLDFNEEDGYIEEQKRQATYSNEGIFYNMDSEKYHNLDGISSTLFKDLELNVAIFTNRFIFKQEKQAFAVGSLNHTALLEPHLLNEYMETSTSSFDTKATKILREDYPDKIIVPLGSIELAKERASKVKLVFGKFTNQGHNEVSVMVYNEITELLHKARPDIWIQDKGIILDYKTSKETTVMGFMNTIERYDYHLSSAWYIDTINDAIDKFNLNIPKVKHFGWIVSPNSSPYKPFGLMASSELVELGREKYSRLLTKLVEVKAGAEDEIFKTAHSYEFRRNNY